MVGKILKISTNKAANCKIHPVLYNFFLRIHDTLGAEIVHRRTRSSSTCIEIIFYCEEILIMTGHLNTLPEAERWGYWVICRKQMKKGRTVHKGHRVYQLYLSPVHPKKRREMTSQITSLNAAAIAGIA